MASLSNHQGHQPWIQIRQKVIDPERFPISLTQESFFVFFHKSFNRLHETKLTEKKIVDTNSKVQNWSRLLFTGETSYIDVHLYKFSPFYSTFKMQALRAEQRKIEYIGRTVTCCNLQHNEQSATLVWNTFWKWIYLGINWKYRGPSAKKTKTLKVVESL